MKVLVFGGAGFLGSSLVPMLRERGHEVIAPRSSEVNLLEKVEMRETFEGIDAVVHAAALYGGMPFDIKNPGQVFSTNSRLNLNVFDFCREAKPKKLITIGSACAYPGYESVNLSEDKFFSGELHSTVECHGFTKLWMIPAHRAYHDSFGISGIHLVPANLYGPGDVYTIERSHVVAALIRKYSDAITDGGDVTLLGDGSAIREFLYIDDLSKLIQMSVERLDHQEIPVNAGTGIGHSIQELAELVSGKVHFQGKTRWSGRVEENGAQRKVMDVQRMHSLFPDFSPIGLSEGIQKTLDWYLPKKKEADKRS